jgi:hypothetical protein
MERPTARMTDSCVLTMRMSPLAFITVNDIAIIYLEKNRKVCTQLKIFQKEIKLTLNQELMHILRERGLLVRVIKI